MRRAWLTAVLFLFTESLAAANGGPFLVREAGGDPATKGMAAPILPDLLPGRESRLHVQKEHLGLDFKGSPGQPLVDVTAEYTIRNPSRGDVVLEIGFPIVRGIFRPTYGGGMGAPGTPGDPVVRVVFQKQAHPFEIISNSDLLTRIRQHAYGIIDAAFAARPELNDLREQLKAAAGKKESAEETQRKLADILIRQLSWPERDAQLMANFARVIWQPPPPPPPEEKPAKRSTEEEIPEWLRHRHPEEGGGRRPSAEGRRQQTEIPFFAADPFHPYVVSILSFGSFGIANQEWPTYLGPLASLGELKATQLFSLLASRFEPAVGRSYEAIFAAWGGDVREKSVDFATGALRPRENTRCPGCDETLYARVDYFNPHLVVDADRRAVCKDILDHLPVTFTFAPMNLIRTIVTFPKQSTTVLRFTYSQHPFEDTVAPATYQLGYLVHPASFWDHFGPIRLTVRAPKGVLVRASVPTKRTGVRGGMATYAGTVQSKTGELLVAVPSQNWLEVVEKLEWRWQDREDGWM